MATLFADRVMELSTSIGIGPIVLSGATTGYQSFATAFPTAVAASITYCIEDATNWEIGVGTFTASTSTLTRTTVTASSNAGAPVSFPAGTKRVFNSQTAYSIGLASNNFGSLSNAVPGGTNERILGQQNNTFVWFKPNGSRIPTQNKPTGNITALEILGNNGTFIAYNPGGTVWTLLTDWQYGFFYPLTSPYLEEVFCMQRRGVAGISLSTANYRGGMANQAAMLALIGTAPGDWCSRTDLGNQRFVQTGANAATLANWTAVPLGVVNQPPADWGSVASQTAQVTLLATLGDVVTRSDLANQKSRLTALPATTFANWTLIDSADFPRIRINNANNISIETLPARHTPVTVQHTGADMWDLY